MVAPDVYVEGVSADANNLGKAVPMVDRQRTGAVGVCASGGFAISAATIDPRIKGIATVSVVDMGGAARQLQTQERRKKTLAAAAEQHYVEAAGGPTRYTGGTVHRVEAGTSAMQREFFDFYRTPRGEFTPQGSSPDSRRTSRAAAGRQGRTC